MHMRAAAAALPGMGRCRRRAQGECRGTDALALGLKGGAKQRLSRQSVRHEVGGRDGEPGLPATEGPASQRLPREAHPACPSSLRRKGERERGRGEQRRGEEKPQALWAWCGDSQKRQAGWGSCLGRETESSRTSSPGILGSLL